MAVITFRVSDEEKDFLEHVASFDGSSSLSEYIRKNSLRTAEDLLDFNTYKMLMAQHAKADESISHDQMKQELGL